MQSKVINMCKRKASYEANIRSNHQSCSVRNGVLRHFAKFTGKHLYQSLFFNKVVGENLWTTASEVSC